MQCGTTQTTPSLTSCRFGPFFARQSIKTKQDLYSLSLSPHTEIYISPSEAISTEIIRYAQSESVSSFNSASVQTYG